MRRTLACLLLILALPVSAQIYKYTDANGNTVFTNQLPEGQAAETVELPPTTTGGPGRWIGSGRCIRSLQATYRPAKSGARSSQTARIAARYSSVRAPRSDIDAPSAASSLGT